MFQGFQVYTYTLLSWVPSLNGGIQALEAYRKSTHTRGVVLGFISPKHQEFHHYGFLENPWVFAGRVSESLSSLG